MSRVVHVGLSLAEVEKLGGYPLIYADPAWNYSNKGRGAAENHYPTMTLAEICALPVQRLASPNAVLFLWVCWPGILKEVPRVLDAWGFEYKTCAFVWVKYRTPSMKKHVGGGFWTRANTEPCLIAVRGKKPPRRVDKTVRQLIESGPEEILESTLEEHSAKPAAARDRVVKLMGDDLPRIELFARERHEGWDVWGNDKKLGGSDVLLTEGERA